MPVSSERCGRLAWETSSELPKARAQWDPGQQGASHPRPVSSWAPESLGRPEQREAGSKRATGELRREENHVLGGLGSPGQRRKGKEYIVSRKNKSKGLGKNKEMLSLI